jgi:hypothetical protein
MPKIYIGNQKTIDVEYYKNKVCLLDLEKTGRVLKENPDKTVVVGATNDWIFTAEEINLEMLEEIKTGKKWFLTSSCWDTFSIKTDDDEKEDCYIFVDEKIFNTIAIENYLTGFKHRPPFELEKEVHRNRRFLELEEYKNEEFPEIIIKVSERYYQKHKISFRSIDFIKECLSEQLDTLNNKKIHNILRNNIKIEIK